MRKLKGKSAKGRCVHVLETHSASGDGRCGHRRLRIFLCWLVFSASSCSKLSPPIRSRLWQ